ncbi:hypothetical protein AQUCO_01600086v1 [Aquilegia coerulea]|uniref:SWIM-type domain-containing protein n=1 Tax=Aquilegia coerulea TaxID=218851 RepID=A0A2G5DQ21_AQUCA|nr:hypothetical protein AQUCO_01600086v1 [Aquilegia coerulea]
MEIIESIHDIPVQDPPEEDFSSADLGWTKYGTDEHHDDVALIPYDRLESFIIGESSCAECPTRFHIERGRARKEGTLKTYKSDEYLLFRVYWCSFGPENYGEGGGILYSRRYRLNTRNRAARPQSMRGCTCHFTVKRLYARPSVVLIIYNNRRQHVNSSGSICHGPLDRDAIGPGAKKVPYNCDEIQQQAMSMIYLGMSEENVKQKYIEGIQRYCGSDAKVSNHASQFVHKLGMIIKRSTHELDLDDQASVRLWVARNSKLKFFYQDASENSAFILGIQSEWQLQQMIRFGNQSLIAADSTFGIKKLKYPVCTILVFDSQQHALPVAWVITRSFAKEDISKWMKALLDRVRSVDSSWRISGFLVDDAAAEFDPIRDIFSCPVLFCLWRVRRSWLRNIVKKCTNIEVQREIFKRLGRIVYSIWGGIDSVDAMEEFIQDFVDQTAFIEYFKVSWVPKIEMWLTVMKTLPLASQEASGAIESYHLKLKQKLYDDSHLSALQRVDWLVHKLTTELHSSYWLDRHADETGSFQNVKEEYIASTSWYRALQIPDTDVILDDKDHLFAKVASQKGTSHVVWNPGSEFSFCDCAWSMKGNLCKHVMKVNTICHNRQGFEVSMSFLSYKQILSDLLQKPIDDSFSLDLSTALTQHVLDRMKRLVELNDSKGIANVVSTLPLKWTAKKRRNLNGMPSSNLALPSNLKSRSKKVAPKKNRKRKRLSRLM